MLKKFFKILKNKFLIRCFLTRGTFLLFCYRFYEFKWLAFYFILFLPSWFFYWKLYFYVYFLTGFFSIFMVFAGQKFALNCFATLPFRKFKGTIQIFYNLFYLHFLYIPHLRGVHLRFNIRQAPFLIKQISVSERLYLFIYLCFRVFLNINVYLLTGAPYFILMFYVRLWEDYLWYIGNGLVKKKSFKKFAKKQSSAMIKNLSYTKQINVVKKNQVKFFALTIVMLWIFCKFF